MNEVALVPWLVGVGIGVYCAFQTYLDIRRKKAVMALLGALATVTLAFGVWAFGRTVFDAGIR